MKISTLLRRGAITLTPACCGALIFYSSGEPLQRGGPLATTTFCVLVLTALGLVLATINIED